MSQRQADHSSLILHVSKVFSMFSESWTTATNIHSSNNLWMISEIHLTARYWISSSFPTYVSLSSVQSGVGLSLYHSMKPLLEKGKQTSINDEHLGILSTHWHWHHKPSSCGSIEGIEMECPHHWNNWTVCSWDPCFRPVLHPVVPIWTSMPPSYPTSFSGPRSECGGCIKERECVGRIHEEWVL